MGGLFSKKQSSRVTQQDQAVLQLKQQRDKLKQFQKRTEGQLKKDREVAGQLLKAGKKSRALLLLRKKKMQEGLLEKTDEQLNTIHGLIQDIEFKQVEQRVMQGLQAGNEALKTLNKLMSLEKVEQILDDTQDAAEYQREISAALSGGLSSQEEADVEAELEALLQVELPDVPTDELPQAEKEPEASPQRSRQPRVALEAS